MPFLIGFLLIALGIVFLAFPDFMRSMNRLGNDMEGVETKHGPAYEANRIISGVILIIGGIVTMFILM